MKKIDGYPHNGYPTDMGTGMGQIFIQQVGYRYETNIYPAGRVRGSYYPYPTHTVDIYTYNPYDKHISPTLSDP